MTMVRVRKYGKYALVVLAALALCLLLVAGYVFSGRVWRVQGDVTLPLSTCDLNRGQCHVALPDDSKLTVEISPRPITALRPLSVRLVWQEGEAERMYFDVTGVEMDMGVNRTRLRETDSGYYLGQITLPVCVTGPMRWRAEFIVEGKQGRLVIPFEFDSGV
jgi:hypothetical protein